MSKKAPSETGPPKGGENKEKKISPERAEELAQLVAEAVLAEQASKKETKH